MTPRRSQAEIDAMKELIFKQHKTYREVAELFGTTPQNIHHFVGPNHRPAHRRKRKQKRAEQ